MRNEATRGSKSISALAPAAIANLQVVLPHRKAQLTRTALKYAASLANDLDARIRCKSRMTLRRSWTWFIPRRRSLFRADEYGHRWSVLPRNWEEISENSAVHS